MRPHANKRGEKRHGWSLARRRCVDHADDGLRQHQRPGDHDRRKNRGHGQGRGLPAGARGVTRVVPSPQAGRSGEIFVRARGLAGGGPSALHESGLESRRPFARPGGAPLAVGLQPTGLTRGTLVVLRAQAGPGDQVSGGREAARPISARMTQALNSLMPGMVVKSWTAVRKGST